MVPLRPAGFAICLVARCNGKGSAFGYFFGSTIEDPSGPVESNLSLGDALLVCKLGDHGIHTGKWRPAGRISPWHPADWPMPLFSRDHDDPDKIYLTEYTDDLSVIVERLLTRDEALAHSSLPEEQLGSGIVEVRLSRLLNSDQVAKQSGTP